MNVFRSFARSIWKAVDFRQKSAEGEAPAPEAAPKKAPPASRLRDGFESAYRSAFRPTAQGDGFEAGGRGAPVDLSGGVKRAYAVTEDLRPPPAPVQSDFVASLDDLGLLMESLAAAPLESPAPPEPSAEGLLTLEAFEPVVDAFEPAAAARNKVDAVGDPRPALAASSVAEPMDFFEPAPSLGPEPLDSFEPAPRLAGGEWHAPAPRPPMTRSPPRVADAAPVTAPPTTASAPPLDESAPPPVAEVAPPEISISAAEAALFVDGPSVSDAATPAAAETAPPVVASPGAEAAPPPSAPMSEATPPALAPSAAETAPAPSAPTSPVAEATPLAIARLGAESAPPPSAPAPAAPLQPSPEPQYTVDLLMPPIRETAAPAPTPAAGQYSTLDLFDVVAQLAPAEEPEKKEAPTADGQEPGPSGP